MHDFCFTFPYGALVLAGGLLGFLLKRSFPSLLGGAISGSLLLFAGYLSLQAFSKGSNSYLALFLQTVISVVLTLVMGQRYLDTGKIMPAGVVAGISGVMALFYLYKLSTGGNHIVKKGP